MLSPSSREHAGTAASSSPSRSQQPTSFITTAEKEKNKAKRGPSAEGSNAKPKTPRACDRCKAKKIKCDIIPATRPPLCAVCKSLQRICSFDTPITELRSKRLRRTEDASSSRTSCTPVESAFSPLSRAKSPSMRIAGRTSLDYILHSTPTIPLDSLSTYNETHGVVMERNADGEGIIKCLYRQTPNGNRSESDLPAESWDTTLQGLMQIYFDSVCTFFPVITAQELMSRDPPSPLLFYTTCALAASHTRRTTTETQKQAYVVLRRVINDILRDGDVLSDVSLTNAQALILLSLCDGLYPAGSMVSPKNIVRTRLGAAIRMLLDLGVHKDPSEQSQRVWICAVLIDRWHATELGMPCMAVDAFPCPIPGPLARAFPFFTAMAELGQLLHAVLTKVYGHGGLTSTKDEELRAIQDGLEAWKDSLPHDLQFVGHGSSEQAGLLQLAHCAVVILFYRCFMRFSFLCPPHVTIDMNVARWDKVLNATREAIEWTASHSDILDGPFIVPYALSLCAVIQYHAWARRKDEGGLRTLERLRDAIDQWDDTLGEGVVPLRVKEYDVVHTLLQAAAIVHQPGKSSFEGQRGLNPAVGVRNTLPTSAVGFAYLSDPSRRAGGILVVTAESAKEIRDLPEGTIVIGNPGMDGDLASQIRIIGRDRTPEREVAETGPIVQQTRAEPAAWTAFMSSLTFPPHMPSNGTLDE